MPAHHTGREHLQCEGPESGLAFPVSGRCHLGTRGCHQWCPYSITRRVAASNSECQDSSRPLVRRYHSFGLLLSELVLERQPRRIIPRESWLILCGSWTREYFVRERRRGYGVDGDVELV